MTPDQAKKAGQIIADVLQQQIDKWFVLPQGSLSSEEIARAGSERETEWQKQLLPLLGEKGCARFQEFQAELPPRAVISLLEGELGASQLNEDQKTKLFQVIKSEPFDLIRGAYGDWDPAFWGSQEYIDKHLSQVAESNQRILQQAGTFLKPDQLNVFSMVLSNGITERITLATALIRKP